MNYIDYCKDCPMVFTSKCNPESRQCMDYKIKKFYQIQEQEQADKDTILKNLYRDMCYRMKQCAEMSDYEIAHARGEDILCEFLRELGYPDIADIYDTIPKW